MYKYKYTLQTTQICYYHYIEMIKKKNNQSAYLKYRWFTNCRQLLRVGELLTKGGIQNQMEPDNIMDHQLEEVYFLDNISSIPLAYVV